MEGCGSVGPVVHVGGVKGVGPSVAVEEGGWKRADGSCTTHRDIRIRDIKNVSDTTHAESSGSPWLTGLGSHSGKFTLPSRLEEGWVALALQVQLITASLSFPPPSTSGSNSMQISNRACAVRFEGMFGELAFIFSERGGLHGHRAAHRADGTN
jgi:hypothetical protein